jgi:hypothetical protein
MLCKGPHSPTWSGKNRFFFKKKNCCFLFLDCLRQNLSMYSPGWPWALDPPASASQVLGFSGLHHCMVSDKAFANYFKGVLLKLCSFLCVGLSKISFSWTNEFLGHLHAVSLPLFCRAVYCQEVPMIY